MAKVLSEKQVFKGTVFAVKELQAELPNGKRMKFNVVEKNDSAMIVPITDDGQLVLQKEYFVASDVYMLSLPKGAMADGEHRLDAANRELQEEAGYKAGELIELGTLTVSPGYIRQKTHVFLARKLTESRLSGDEDEEIEVKRIPFADFEKLVYSHEISEARVIAALFLAKKYLETNKK
jgi:8-oxo-dGTP pyrophosphatase MutT (NUDIX family)